MVLALVFLANNLNTALEQSRPSDRVSLYDRKKRRWWNQYDEDDNDETRLM